MTYVGGSFSYVGPATGGGAAVSRTTGLVDPGFPTVAGHIRAVAADGTGGWYVGGDFTSIGGLPRTNLAHVLANGMVDDWNPVAESSPLGRPAVVTVPTFALRMFQLVYVATGTVIAGRFSAPRSLPSES